MASKGKNILSAYMVHDDHWYLAESAKSFAIAGPVAVFVSRKPWNGAEGDWERSVRVAEAAEAEVVLGDWTSEEDHRRAVLSWAAKRTQTLLVPDSDEIVEPELLDKLVRAAGAGIAQRMFCEMDTYWKSPEYVIRPRERLLATIAVDPRVCEVVRRREYSGGAGLVLGAEHGVLHHLSYAGPEDRIRRKIETWSHANEVVPDWERRVWTAWDDDRTMRDLHPTHPEAYGFAERIKPPKVLQPAWARYVEACGGEDPLHPAEAAPRKVEPWPSVSVVIPLYGGPNEIETCLATLADSADLLSEVVVVDDRSPDEAPEVVKDFAIAKLIRNEKNLGFGQTCNRGIEATTGEIVLLLNSDAYPTRPAILRLIESISNSGSVAAAGPYSDNVGHLQRTPVTFTDPQRARLFAEDFALRPDEDEECDMLVGFCLAVRRRALDDAGLFDPAFGTGLFEDNDLCHRLRRAGYRLVLSKRSFVRHVGHASLNRKAKEEGVVGAERFATNEALYRAKWRRDVESGFASHLCGTSSERVRFDESRKPERLEREIAALRKKADVSLCMIVKNEERVLADCLTSAKPFFRQIVVVDTGSTDRTIEIAERHGAEVVRIEWPDSFAQARNESLARAKGRWIFWMDADDTLPWASGETILRAAVSAAPEIAGFVVPVRFVTDDPLYGTRVDHVKLFRNRKNVRFEGRIHEQILPSLRASGGEIARLDCEVLHSGYDTSDEGQKRKRERDYRLLELDLADAPEHPFKRFNLGMTLHYDQRHEEALEQLARSIANAHPNESHVRKARALQTVSLKALGRVEEAKETIERGLDAAPGDPELLFHRAGIAWDEGRLEDAVADYFAVLGSDISGNFSSVDLGILGFKSHLNIAGVHMQAGRYLAARDHFRRAIELHPGHGDGIAGFFRAALSAGDLSAAEDCLRRLAAAEGTSVRWAELLGEAARASGGPGLELDRLRAAAAAYPHSFGPGLVLARRLSQEGFHAEALPLLLRLESQDVAEAAFFLGVHAQRSGRFEEALGWMERALALNPGHDQTLRQVEGLRRALGR